MNDGFLEDSAMRAVFALVDVPPEEIELNLLLIVRNRLNVIVSKAMEAQNAVKGAE